MVSILVSSRNPWSSLLLWKPVPGSCPPGLLRSWSVWKADTHVVLLEQVSCELAYGFWKAVVSLHVIITFSSSFFLSLWIFFLHQEYSPQANSLTRKVTLMMNVETHLLKHCTKTPAEIIFLHLYMAPSPTFFFETNVTFQLVLSKKLKQLCQVPASCW